MLATTKALGIPETNRVTRGSCIGEGQLGARPLKNDTIVNRWSVVDENGFKLRTGDPVH